MDEPTTHLDIPSIDALISALKRFEGTIIFISHDVYFIRSIAQNLLHVEAGRTTFYPGDYQYFLDKTSATSERDALVSGDRDEGPAKAAAPERVRIFKTKEEKRAEAEARNAIAKQRREAKARVEALEAEVFALEARQKELTAKLESPEAHTSSSATFAVNRDLANISDELERKTAAWEKAAELLGELTESK
jgi:ATP-binding cassette subfamily F protein 3